MRFDLGLIFFCCFIGKHNFYPGRRQSSFSMFSDTVPNDTGGGAPIYTTNACNSLVGQYFDNKCQNFRRTQGEKDANRTKAALSESKEWLHYLGLLSKTMQRIGRKQDVSYDLRSTSQQPKFQIPRLTERPQLQYRKSMTNPDVTVDDIYFADDDLILNGRNSSEDLVKEGQSSVFPLGVMQDIEDLQNHTALGNFKDYNSEELEERNYIVLEEKSNESYLT